MDIYLVNSFKMKKETVTGNPELDSDNKLTPFVEPESHF
jgi:hypothetical protein